MREGGVQRHIWLALSGVSRLFRINTGQAWLSGAGPVKRLPDGSVLVPAARPVALGLGMPDGKPLVGASDLLGWTPVQITPDMVGKTVAIMTAIEVKDSAGGRRRPEQINFVEQINRAGGIAGFASSPEQAQSLIHEALVRIRS